MSVPELSLIGPDGDEVYVRFQDTPDRPIDLYAFTNNVERANGDPEYMPGVEWKQGTNNLFRHAADPAKALELFLKADYQFHGEDDEWYKTGQWPDTAQKEAQ